MKINLDEDDVKTAIEAFLQKRTKGLDFKVEVTPRSDNMFVIYVSAKDHKPDSLEDEY